MFKYAVDLVLRMCS